MVEADHIVTQVPAPNDAQRLMRCAAEEVRRCDGLGDR